MTIKQKIEKAKTKIAKHKIGLITSGVVATAIAGGVYAIIKDLSKPGEPILLIPQAPEDYDDVVIMATSAARDKISEDSTFALKHEHLDLYSLDIVNED